MILEEMINKYNVLIFFKERLTEKRFSKQIVYINSQVNLLNQLIKHESYNVLNELLRKTNYRLLKQIDKGYENIVNIYKFPHDWQLYKLENCRKEILNKDSLIFSTERETLVFTKNNYEDSFKYINNKWQ